MGATVKSLISAGGLLIVCLLATGTNPDGLHRPAAPREPSHILPPGMSPVGTTASLNVPAMKTVAHVTGRRAASPSASPSRRGGGGKDGGTRTARSALMTGPVFNDPHGGTGAQSAISTQIGKLIDATPRGAVIYVAMYHFSARDLAAKLVRANRRQVQVRVVLDHESTGFTAYTTLRNGLGGDTKKPSWVIVCGTGRGCIGPQFNHNKFFLFSTTTGSKKVVVQTSANATYASRDLQWNDALTVKNADVYAGYRDYFYDLATRRQRPDYHRVVQAGSYRLDFFPWSSGDPVSTALDSVSCAGGTRIRLMLDYFTWSPVAQRLWSLDDQGCQVQIFFSHVGTTVARDLLKQGGRNSGPEVRYLPDHGQVYAHSKYLLIDGRYQGTPQKIVFTGSNNYTAAGFHGHDEAMLTIADGSLETRYAANFDAAFEKGGALKPADASVLSAGGVVGPDSADDTADLDE
jgi:phosphatidylserine/phosphatidylglycerophosphate/cardiolipin synthase-like enzyme